MKWDISNHPGNKLSGWLMCENLFVD